MGEYINSPEKQNKNEGSSATIQNKNESSEAEFIDSSSSTFQLLQLQGAADDNGKNNRITQLQSRANQYTNSSDVNQLKSKIDTQSRQNFPIQPKENNTGLPEDLRSGMESISGISLHDVKVHRNSDKPAQLQAHAYAQGTSIHLGPGQEKHLPHELAHVVQQKEGRVKPTLQMKGNVKVNDDTGLEKEADVLGQKAMSQGKSSFNTASELTENNPTAQLVVQKVDTLKSSDAQTTAAKDNPVSDAEKANVTSSSTNDPLTHPMFANFKARITSVFSDFPPPDGVDLNSLTEHIWTQICTSINDSTPEFDRTPSNDTYSNVGKGYVNMESAGYKRALNDFNIVMSVLKQVTSAQFLQAKSFGFWSKPEGREFAEKMTDLTLETSGIGSLFDGMPSLNAHQNGWDVQLWGSLSQAFGQAVAKQMSRDITVNVCAGGGTDKTNIFGIIESKALEKGASAVHKSLEQAVTFHSIAAKSKSNRKVNYDIKEGDMGLPGTWYSGNSWNYALAIGVAKFNDLPD